MKKRAKPNTGGPKLSVGLKTQEEAIPKQSEKRKPTVQEAMREKAAISATDSPKTEKDGEPERREDSQSSSSQRNRRHHEKKIKKLYNSTKPANRAYKFQIKDLLVPEWEKWLIM